MKWRPHTQAPEGRITGIIATRLKDDGDPSPFLLPLVFWFDPAGGWLSERTGEPVKYPEYWWMPESELLEGLPCSAS